MANVDIGGATEATQTELERDSGQHADFGVGIEAADGTKTTKRLTWGRLKTIVQSGVSGTPADGSITTAKLANDAVTNAKIADDAIEEEQIADGEVKTAALADDSVTLAKMASGTADKFLGYDGSGNPAEKDAPAGGGTPGDGSITTAKLANGAVTTPKLGADAVTGDKIADGAVNTEHFADGAVDSSALANDSVTNSKIADDAVDTDQLADDSVTDAKFDGRLGPEHRRDSISNITSDTTLTASNEGEFIAVGSSTGNITITLPTLADNSNVGFFLRFLKGVSANSVILDPPGTKLINGASTWTLSNLFESAYIKWTGTAWAVVAVGNRIVDGSIGTSALESDAVTGAKIADGAVNTEHFADGAVDSSALGNNSVTNSKIADDAIEEEQIGDGEVKTVAIADDAVTLAKLAGGTAGKVIGFDTNGNPVEIDIPKKWEFHASNTNLGTTLTNIGSTIPTGTLVMLVAVAVDNEGHPVQRTTVIETQNIGTTAVWMSMRGGSSGQRIEYKTTGTTSPFQIQARRQVVTNAKFYIYKYV